MLERQGRLWTKYTHIHRQEFKTKILTNHIQWFIEGIKHHGQLVVFQERNIGK